MTEVSVENPRISNLVKYEDDLGVKGVTREEVTLNLAAQTELQLGSVLGATLTGGSGTPTADGGNTGNGTVDSITIGGEAKTGVYTIEIVKAAVDAGDFVVSGPDGSLVGYGTVGVAFSKNGINFTLSDGATDFVVGDKFTLAVTGTIKYDTRDPDASDGLQNSAAVVLFMPTSNGLLESTKETIAATTDTTAIVLKPKKGAYAVVADEALVFDVTHDASERATAVAELNAIGIHTKTQA